ncbi:MAG TPA: TetR/AcrR family transcriptional regulator [Reyranellaceae bacterium]|nr:TetR/AcrR family transcriptional regulator [Reyranellaceae bacterium]
MDQPGKTPQATRGDRVARTREAIVAATLTLAAGGAVTPIVRDIAQIAGVSARTVFQHFADTAELYLAVLSRVLATMADLPEPTAAWPLERRIEVLSDAFAARFEQLLPLWPFFQGLQQRSAEAAGLMAALYAGSRTRVGQWFAAELATLSEQTRERAVNALCVAMAPEGWIVLRQRLGLSPDDARAEWRYMMATVLSAKR